MKTIFNKRGLALAGLGLMIFAAPALRAHEGMDGMKGMKGMDDAKMLEHMKVELSLNDHQAAQVKAEYATDGEACKLLRDKMELDVAKLKVMVDKKAGNDELKPVIVMIRADQRALEAQKEKHIDAMQEILEPKQQAKAIFMMQEHMGGHGMMKDGHKDGDDKHREEGEDKDDDKKHKD